MSRPIWSGRRSRTSGCGCDLLAPLACLLVGEPILRRRIKLGILAALDQRIAVRYAMPGMTGEETTSYIRRHLKLVGRSDPADSRCSSIAR